MQVQEQRLAPSGGLVQTILKATGERLRRASVQKMLFGRYGIVSYGYLSMADALFVETFAEFQESCQAFYSDEGPPLRKIITEEEVQAYDVTLVGLIEMAHYRELMGEPLCWRATQAVFYRFIQDRPTIRP